MQIQAQRRSALITGGAGGIGSEIGRRLAGDGYRVVIADVQEDRAREIAAHLPSDGHAGVAIDVTKESSVREALDRAEKAAGPIHVLVHAAGVLLTQTDGSHLRFWESGTERWDNTMAINARGSFLVAAEFARRRVAEPVRDGRIVLFSSLLGQAGGTRTFADYSASKAAVLGFLRAAARDCALLGITVNAIAPGQIETPMLRLNIPKGTPVDDKAVLMGRYGEPADIAAAVRYIVSPEASFVTGATFDINGGQRMQ